MRLLAGVMRKSQEIDFSQYEVDLEDVLTVSALSLRIFRKQYLDEESFHIHIPNRKQDSPIRRILADT